MKLKLNPLKTEEKVFLSLKELLFDEETQLLSTWNLKVLKHPRDCASDLIQQWFEHLRGFELDVKRKVFAKSYLVYCSDVFLVDYLEVMWEALLYWLSFEFPNNPALIAFSSSDGGFFWRVLINAAAVVPCSGLGKLTRLKLQKSFEQAALMVFRKRLELEDLNFEQLCFLLKKPRKRLEELRL